MVHLKRIFSMLLFSVLIIIGMFPADSIIVVDQPLFNVTIIAPGNVNLLRRQWGQMFADSLLELGINASVVFLGWGEVYDRVLTPPLDKVGKTFDEGGYDVLLLGWTPGLFPEPRQLYYGGDPSFFAPAGQNYYLWNNTQSNNLLDTFITSTNKTARDITLQKWQEIYFREVPGSQIMYQSAPAIIDPDLEGYDWIYFNVQPSPEWLKFTANPQTSVVYASTAQLLSLVPPLSSSWYDTIAWNPIYNGLEQINNLKQNIPALVVSKNASADGFKWTYNLRSGVKWHDGFDFSADDVLFSYWALMNAATGSQFVGYFQNVFGNRVQFTWQNGTSTWLNATTTPARVGYMTATNPLRVDFTLPVLANGKPYGYIDPYLLAFANNIIPKHIFEKIRPAQWATSVFNTGVLPISGPVSLPGITNVTYYGPIGTGPYKWVEFNAPSQVVHLQKFPQYWNASELEGKGQFGVTDYYVRYIADKTSALAALEGDEVDMLDPNYQMQTEVITPGAIDPSWGTIFLLNGTDRQEIGYNMRHPIFGTGEDTPLGLVDPSRAAEAARYVRTAFDYAIQRQQIVDDLLDGFGQPAATPVTPLQPYFNSSIVPRPYDLVEAGRYLENAGYYYPGVYASFTYSPAHPVVGQEVVFDASESYSPNATIVSYSWDFGDATFAVETGPITTHVFYNASVFEVLLRVADDAGHVASVRKAVKVDSPPFVSFTWTPEWPGVNETVWFDSYAYDPDGYVVGWGWDFGDGSYASEPMTQHAYSQAGTYVVSLTVVDNDNLTATAYNEIVVAPRLLISVNPSSGIVGSTVSVTGADATSDGMVEFYWGSYVSDYYGWYINYTFLGTVTADSTGEFSFSFEVPASAAGPHSIRAVDVTTSGYAEEIFRVQPHLSIDPVSGPIGTKVTLAGTGFPYSYSMGPGYGYLMFDDQMYGIAMADQNGNLQAVMDVPLASAGPHAVKALVMAYYPYPEPSKTYIVEETFTVIDMAPLHATADVGAIFFKGETAEFYVQTTFKGEAVDATSLQVELNMPDGSVETLQAEKIGAGLYQVKYAISGKGSMTGTYTLSVEAAYATEYISSHGGTIKTFMVKPTWQRELPRMAAFSIASIGVVGAMVLVWRREKKRFP